MLPKKLRPLNGYALVDPAKKEEKKTAAGIIIPDTNSKESRRRLDKGTVVLVEENEPIAKGETVYFTPGAGIEVLFGEDPKAYRAIPTKQLALVLGE